MLRNNSLGCCTLVQQTFWDCDTHFRLKQKNNENGIPTIKQVEHSLRIYINKRIIITKIRMEKLLKLQRSGE